MQPSKTFPLNWASTFLNNTDFDNLNTFYQDEITAARYIYGYKLTRDAAKAYFKGLKANRDCDADESERLRHEGNTLYKRKEELGAAATKYSKAIFKAPNGSSALARAHANRAAVLFKLQAYKAAYEDCVYAMHFNHPNADAILTRQSIIALELAKEQKLQDNVVYDPFVSIDCQAEVKNSSSHITIPKVPALSKPTKFKKFKILQSPERGRFYVADERIEANEVIIEEEVAVFIPIREWDKSVYTCDKCAETDIVPFPCYDCRAVSYCSINCHKKHSSIHRFECSGYKMGLFENFKQGHLAFRCLLAVFDPLLEELTSLTRDMEIHNATDLWPIALQTCKDGEILGLFSDFKLYQKHRSILKDAILASLLCSYLSDQTDFFERNHPARHALLTSEFEWRLFVTSLLLRLLVQVHFNTAAINQYVPANGFSSYLKTVNSLYKTLELRYDTVGIHPHLSLLNHSCNCNTFLRHQNLKASLICRTPIPKGTEITSDYIWNSARQSRSERIKVLKDTYHFVCDCNRCKNEQDEICVKASGATCECGGVCLLCNKDAACSMCGKNSNAEYYFNALTNVYMYDNSAETFIYLYGTYAMLKNALKMNGVLILAECAENILTKYLSISNIDQCVHDDEQVNVFLVKIAVDVLEQTRHEYLHPLERCKFVVMLLDILAIRKQKRFPNLQSKHQAFAKQISRFILGKSKKLFDKFYTLYCM